MNKNTIMAIVVLIVVVVGGYGAYRLYKHYNKPAVTPVATAPATKMTPTVTTTTTENSVYKTANDSKLGAYLTDTKGATLYTYSKDTTGVSNCSGKCLVNWPAYVATSETNLPANISVITRSGGTKQYAWKGMPLYYFIQDKSAGEITGDGVGGFSVAK